MCPYRPLPRRSLCRSTDARFHSLTKVSLLSALLVLGSGCGDNSTAVLGTAAEATGSGEARTAFIDSTRERVEAAQIPGLSVAVVDSSGAYWGQGFGNADLALGSPMTDRSIQAIGSLTKSVTSLAAMQTVEAGLLELDQDINSWLPFEVKNPRHPEQSITLRHLLTHTSGIIDDPTLYQSTTVYNFGEDHPVELGDFMRDYLTPTGAYYSTADNFSEALPGELFQYSNIGFALVAHLVEVATARSFRELTREDIFVPLGMASTGWKLGDVDSERVVQQYGDKESPLSAAMSGEPMGPWRAFLPYGMVTYPDGGLRTSVEDFSRFLAAVMGGGQLGGVRVLQENTAATMLTLQDLGEHNSARLMEAEAVGEALGFFQFPDLGGNSGSLRLGHGGSDPGTGTLAFFEPDADIGVVVFMNADVRTEEMEVTFRQTAEQLFHEGQALLD